MRAEWVLLIIGGLVAGQTLAAPQSEAEAARNQILQRGEYVARAGGCLSCHSEPTGKAFAGGGAIKTPFGDLYAPNITSDKSGIAGWEEQDFERAVRVGVRKDGQLLYPGMPYTSYAHMSRDDMAALWNYLRLMPAVSHTTPQAALIFPFNLRPGVAIWQSIYYKPTPFTPLSAKGEAWNRGHYLVEAIGHCDTCHSTLNSAAGADGARHLTQAQLTGWYIPALDSDPLAPVAGWKLEDVTAFLQNGPAPGSHVSTKPVHDSLTRLTDADRLAMATYLKDPLATASAEHSQAITTASDENLREGKQLYQRNCISCHGANGQAKKTSLAANSAASARSPYAINLALLEGVKPHGNVGGMESFAKSLDDQQIADITNYVRTAWGNHGEPNATPWTVGSWRVLLQLPANVQPAALTCPTVDESVFKPALMVDPKVLRQAAHDRAQLESLVTDYERQRPKSSGAEIIEAMSGAYCRAITTAGVSPALGTGEVADYAQQVALTLASHRAPKAAGSAGITGT
jgi:mono/diheme cytochrome c family protein